jgi:hypothetical protein
MATITAKKTTNGFPEKELQAWLKGRTAWNHEDWLNLLKILRQKGFGKWTDNEEGRTKLGQFLEAERKK